MAMLLSEDHPVTPTWNPSQGWTEATHVWSLPTAIMGRPISLPYLSRAYLPKTRPWKRYVS